MPKTEQSSYHPIQNEDYYKNQMVNREVETILATLEQNRAELISKETETRQERRQINQDRYTHINKNIVETHLEKWGLSINSAVAGLQILGSFAGQSPLATFISGLAQAGNATTKCFDASKQSEIQKLDHIYRDLGGLINERTQEIQNKNREFDQSIQEQARVLNSAQRLAELMVGNN